MPTLSASPAVLGCLWTGGPALRAVARSVKRSCTFWGLHLTSAVAIVTCLREEIGPLGHEKEGPAGCGAFPALILLELSPGARALYNAYIRAWYQTGDDSVSSLYV